MEFAEFGSVCSDFLVFTEHIMRFSIMQFLISHASCWDIRFGAHRLLPRFCSAFFFVLHVFRSINTKQLETILLERVSAGRYDLK